MALPILPQPCYRDDGTVQLAAHPLPCCVALGRAGTLVLGDLDQLGGCSEALALIGIEGGVLDAARFLLCHLKATAKALTALR